jgi:hypothetical protein
LKSISKIAQKRILKLKQKYWRDTLTIVQMDYLAEAIATLAMYLVEEAEKHAELTTKFLAEEAAIQAAEEAAELKRMFSEPCFT